jgi:hypothetical protein
MVAGIGPSCIPAARSLLSLPDDCLLYILALLHESSVPSLPSRLSGRSLDSAAESNALASTCSRLRNLFRGSVIALSINWRDPIGSTITKLFASGLRHLAVSQHSQASRFVRSAADESVPLKTLQLSECRVDHDSLSSALRGMRSSLITLSLCYVEGSGVLATLGAAATCSGLLDLTLHGMPDVSHQCLIRLFQPQLRALSIGYLRHPSMGNETLRAISTSCPSLVALQLEDTRWASPKCVADSCIALAPSIRLLSLKSCSMSDDLVHEILGACHRISAVTIQDRMATRVSASSLVRCAGLRSCSLRSLDVSGNPHLCDEHVLSIVQQSPNLRELRVANSPLVSDISLRAIVTDLMTTIEIIDVEKCSITDSGLEFVGAVAPRRLRAFRFGTSGTPTVAGGALDWPVLSNHGVEELARGLGQSLRVIYLRCAARRGQGAASSLASGLSAEGVAKSLAMHCPHLEAVCIDGLLPPLRQRVLRARAELALIELEDAAPKCALYVDTAATPEFVSVTWRELVVGQGNGEGAS